MKNIVIFDIECVSFGFKLDKGCLLTVGYKYLDDGKPVVLKRKFPADPFDDKALCKEAYDVIANAEAVITHNGKRFDIPALNTRLLLNGLPVLPPTLRHFDTCETVFKKLKMGASLKNQIHQFNLPSEKTSLDLQGSIRAMMGDKKEMALLVDHCYKDVVATEALYHKLKGLGAPGWSMQALSERPAACPICGEAGRLQRRGWNKAITKKSPRYQCQKCFGWSAGKTVKLEEAA